LADEALRDDPDALGADLTAGFLGATLSEFDSAGFAGRVGSLTAGLLIFRSFTDLDGTGRATTDVVRRRGVLVLIFPRVAMRPVVYRFWHGLST